jgi:uncharacterized protein
MRWPFLSLKKTSEAYSGPFAQTVDLLILQPTAFCNIDCDYCYLPNRDSRQRMDMDTVGAAVRAVVQAGLVQERLSVVWHAGEPLVLPPSYYEEAFQVVRANAGNAEVRHSFQSNGILIDDLWCEFLARHHVRLGLSIDGPASLHDAHRKTRQGKGTHALTMRGVESLREHGISFHVIAVVSSDALDQADAIFDFFKQLGIEQVGFNVEELEGEHGSSSLVGKSNLARIEGFWQRLYELWESSDQRLQIREFQSAARGILNAQTRAPWQEIAAENHQVLPLSIVSVDWSGRLSSFSPELLGWRNNPYNDFTFGNVNVDDLETVRKSPLFQQVASEVWRGARECAATCEYFSVCKGGAPSNKYFENGSFSSTETMYCRAAIQLPTRTVLRSLEQKLNIRHASRESVGN